MNQHHSALFAKLLLMIFVIISRVFTIISYEKAVFVKYSLL